MREWDGVCDCKLASIQIAARWCRHFVVLFFFFLASIETSDRIKQTMPGLVTIDSKDHFEELLFAKPPCLLVVKFGATWCRPCQKVKPKFHSFADETSGITCACVDMTQQSDLQDLAIQVGAFSIPFFAVFYDGKLLASEQTSNINQVKLLVSNTQSDLARCDSKKISQPKESKDSSD